MSEGRDFLVALNRNLTDSTALQGSLPANLRSAADAYSQAEVDALLLNYYTSSQVDTALSGKAAKGANSDITSITGLTTPLSVAQGGTGQDTLPELTASLAAFTGDSGAGGLKGLVPAPAAGDTAGLKFLKADGTWSAAPLAARTITGTANQIAVADGNGVSGNPTISLPADVVIPTVLTAPNTGLHILDTDASHDLIVKPGSNITADRTLTITTGDADRTLDISGGSVTITAAAATVLDDATVGAMATTLGLGTGNSPQFTGIELGHATDTTITRASAGVIAVEGVNILTTGTLDSTLAAKSVSYADLTHYFVQDASGVKRLPLASMLIADRATAAAATVGNATFLLLQAYSTAVSPWRGATTYRLAVDSTEYTAFPTELKFTTADSKKFVACKLIDAWGAGARGDGSTDDYAALQAYAWFCGYTGSPFILPDSPNDYRISAKIVFKTTRDLATTDITPTSDIHFTDMLPFKVEGQGKAKVVATASMTSMFEFIFDTGDTDIGPFYTTVSNIQFDGNAVATACIKSDYTMHLTVQNCRFHGATRGIDVTGYGVSRYRDNVFRCKYGIYLVGGGGDTTIASNDFFSAENASACIYLGYYAGDTLISGNVFTNEDAYTTAYAIQMAGSTAAASEEIRDIAVSHNEFCGVTAGVKATGKASGTKNIWRCLISGNHVTPFSSSNTGTLIDATDATDFIIHDNNLNCKRSTDATADAIKLLRCERFEVHHNKIANYLIAPIYDQDGVDNIYSDNILDDVGKTGTGYTVIDVYGSSGARIFRRNVFRQSSGSYAQNGIYERDSANYTTALDNEFTNISTPQRKAASGTNSVMIRTEYTTAAPSAQAHNVGDRAINIAPSAGGTPGWVCTTAGTPGTWKAMANVAA